MIISSNHFWAHEQSNITWILCTWNQPTNVEALLGWKLKGISCRLLQNEFTDGMCSGNKQDNVCNQQKATSVLSKHPVSTE
ncbi:hypothetical protein AVEN_163821-1 [Araneus ventricosus]|uniref:Uncharacterized protein n=1 Tax=Araneus ventricosus TaxID=182803 RepID=A0A4Y2NIS8_ARAVE|nr:hypothetical protein AVEN_163821-1 [Araneus ventricosus]